MKNNFVSACTFFTSAMICFSLQAQQNLQGLYNQLRPVAQSSVNSESATGKGYTPHLTPLFALQEKTKSFHPNVYSTHSHTRVGSYPDTLIVGVKPYDTLIITGTLTHNGPIFVALNGVLIIKKATLTNLGDIDVFNHGKVIIDSSTLSFPQSYFYQRSLVLINKATVTISNTTLAYGGLSHNCEVADTAVLTLNNVTQPDWMTTGINNSGTISINGTNQAGEFILQDYCTLNIKHATNALLWHQFSDTSVINWSFGMHDTTYGYQFNNTKPGVRGIEYHVNADSVYDIMWGMMPSARSTVNITNSKIRSIGLWFDRPADSTQVSGMTDNATYSNFTTPLSDRTLTFSNCTVETWSFYVFHKSIINVTGCIAGEIGTENASKMYGTDYVVDGSGGYHWSADTSLIFADGATVYTYVRSEGNSLFIFAYGSVGGSGAEEAIDKSLLIMVQSSLPADPTAVNGGAAELDNINSPGNLFADSIAPVYGSAWIHRGPTSAWMYFKNWQLFYHAVDSSKWIPITGLDTNPASNSLLANWNTHSLASGTYLLELQVTDTWGNKVDAVREVTLLPLILGIDNLSASSGMNVYPNPNNGEFTIVESGKLKMENGKNNIEIYNMLGEKVYSQFSTLNSPFSINLSEEPNGIYLYRVTAEDGSLIGEGKLMIQK